MAYLILNWGGGKLVEANPLSSCRPLDRIYRGKGGGFRNVNFVHSPGKLRKKKKIKNQEMLLTSRNRKLQNVIPKMNHLFH